MVDILTYIKSFFRKESTTSSTGKHTYTKVCAICNSNFNTSLAGKKFCNEKCVNKHKENLKENKKIYALNYYYENRDKKLKLSKKYKAKKALAKNSKKLKDNRDVILYNKVCPACNNNFETGKYTKKFCGSDECKKVQVRINLHNSNMKRFGLGYKPYKNNYLYHQGEDLVFEEQLKRYNSNNITTIKDTSLKVFTKICIICAKEFQTTSNVRKLCYNEECKAQHNKKWKTNRQTSSKQWKKNNPDKVKQYYRDYLKQWKKNNPDKVKQYAVDRKERISTESFADFFDSIN